MELSTKEDCPQAVERINAWWEGEMIDRALIMVTSPKNGVDPVEWSKIYTPPSDSEENMRDWFINVDRVIERTERFINSTYWGGEAIPYILPVSVNIVAVTAAYLGCPYRFFPGSGSGWAEPVINDWNQVPKLEFDPENEWWKISKKLLEALSARAKGRYMVGVPDLNAPGEVLALLRGTERLLVDMAEIDPQIFKDTLKKIDEAWLRYWQASIGVIHQHVGGYVWWMGIWSDRPSIDLQNDYSCMISSKMFDDIFMPSIEQQTQWVERTIYHLDGPNAVRHLDSLLSLPRMTGIQWVPGAGAPPQKEWLPLLRRVQAKGKRLALFVDPSDVEDLVTGLQPEGLLMSTTCASEEEARDLIKKVAKWSVKRKWMVH